MTEPHELVAQLIDEHVKGIALRMGCNESWVYRQKEPDSCIYTRFLSFLLALQAENKSLSDELLTDLNCRYKAQTGSSCESLESLIADSARQGGEAVAAALCHDLPGIHKRREGLQAIAAHERVVNAINGQGTRIFIDDPDGSAEHEAVFK